MKRPYLLVALLVAGVLLYWTEFRATQRPVEPLPCANVVAGCVWPQQGLNIRFDRHPQAMQPFRLTVEAENAHAVHVSFTMRDMPMGLNRYRLLSEGGGVWASQIILPICVQGRSDWLMLIEIDTGKQIERVQIPFTAQANH